jgi:hypothetical protein
MAGTVYFLLENDERGAAAKRISSRKTERERERGRERERERERGREREREREKARVKKGRAVLLSESESSVYERRRQL